MKGLDNQVFGDWGYPRRPVGMGWARRQRHTRILPQPCWGKKSVENDCGDHDNVRDASRIAL